MESFPPDAPIATRSPRWKRVLLTMVAWISASKTDIKQVLQRRSWVLGRRICAREVLQWTHSLEVGDLSVVMVGCVVGWVVGWWGLDG